MQIQYLIIYIRYYYGDEITEKMEDKNKMCI